jgi:hypothetical protein
MYKILDFVSLEKQFSESFSSDNTRLSTSTISSISSKISYLIDNYYYILKNKYNILFYSKS